MPVPAALYAYTDPRGALIHLYGWSDGVTNYYTLEETAQVDMHLYDVTGVDTLETIGVVNQDGSWKIDAESADTFLRDSLLDTEIYSGKSDTVYTDTTTLVTGLPLYDNEGNVYQGIQVGTVTGDRFEIEEIPL